MGGRLPLKKSKNSYSKESDRIDRLGDSMTGQGKNNVFIKDNAMDNDENDEYDVDQSHDMSNIHDQIISGNFKQYLNMSNETIQHEFRDGHQQSKFNDRDQLISTKQSNNQQIHIDSAEQNMSQTTKLHQRRASNSCHIEKRKHNKTTTIRNQQD